MLYWIFQKFPSDCRLGVKRYVPNDNTTIIIPDWITISVTYFRRDKPYISRRYYSAQVHAQWKVSFLFLNYHDPVGRHTVMTRKDQTQGRLLYVLFEAGSVTLTTSKPRVSEKFLIEKPNFAFCSTRESNFGPSVPRSRPTGHGKHGEVKNVTLRGW